MQNKVQLYIEDQRVDLFDDENIEIKSTIQDIKDIGKVFTDYSKSFNIPASPTNNKIFKHYYNYHIVEGAYDSRKKVKGEIHINHIPFRIGKIFLVGVNIRNNKPHTYKVVFYGNMVSLKDLLGEDELPSLAYYSPLSNLNHTYNNSTVKGGFTTGITYSTDTSALIYPLITPEKRLFYHSGTPSFNSDGNLYVDGDANNNGRGLAYTDLKPAVKCKYIIDAIEAKYGISFTDDFWDSVPFSNLYMWLSREKGNIVDYSGAIDLGGEQTAVTTLTGFTEDTVEDMDSTMVNNLLEISVRKVGFLGTKKKHRIFCEITPTDSNNTSPLTVKAIDTVTNETLGVVKTTNGDITKFDEFAGDAASIVLLFETQDTENRDYKIKFVVEQKNTAVTFKAKVRHRITKFFGGDLLSYQLYNASSDSTISPAYTLDLSYHIPKIKTIDFLTGLFKMFNLTAYYVDDQGDPEFGKIKIDTLDNFYSNATNNPYEGTLSINKYLDNSEHQVNAAIPYSSIKFLYKETDVLLMSEHLSTFNEVFGNSEYKPTITEDNGTVTPAFDMGKSYEVKVPFSHMKYERLLDLDDDTQTSIQWGYAAGGEFKADTNSTPSKGDYDPRQIKPLIFYGIQETGLSNPIAFRNGDNTTTSVTSYWRPSNSNEEGTSTVPPDFTINFDMEIDEWQGTSYNGSSPDADDTSNSLFKKFYKNYIESAFNPQKRLFTVTAYFPANILVNYRMNDQIKIQDKVFRINSITTDITTGNSKLELLNIFSNEIIS